MELILDEGEFIKIVRTWTSPRTKSLLRLKITTSRHRTFNTGRRNVWDDNDWPHNSLVRYSQGESLVLGYCSGLNGFSTGDGLQFHWVQDENRNKLSGSKFTFKLPDCPKHLLS